MARRWQAEATTKLAVDPSFEAGMAGPEAYNPEVSAHVRVAWPPGTDLAIVERAIREAAVDAIAAAHTREQRGGR